MEIRDNTFQRQFEATANGKLVTIEYSFQERKIFLTRITIPENSADEDFINELIEEILKIAIERKLKVVPVFPKIAAFFRKNPRYKELLPPGIKI
jgi:predicted GNAT family acetyltransferase